MALSPKLYVNKPKKAQLKEYQQQQASAPTPTPTPTPAEPSMAGGGAPPPQPPKESFVRRYKYLWPMLLAVNFSIGAYLFMRTKKKDVGTDEGAMSDVPGVSISTPAAITVGEKEKEVNPTPTLQPVIVQDPIAENQQRELFKWMLEEKRRVKPKDQEEKKRLDEEKAILKHFIRSKSIPVL